MDAPVPREGQLIFFAQFLHGGGRWARLLAGCPLRSEGDRGSEVADVVGAAALPVLCGHWRYAHIHVVRRAMKRLEESAGLRWLRGELRACIEPGRGVPWVRDIDATAKPLYGHQQGAQIGYTPRKTSTTNSRTNGAGTASPPKRSPAAGSWPTSSPCSTTAN